MGCASRHSDGSEYMDAVLLRPHHGSISGERSKKVVVKILIR